MREIIEKYGYLMNMLSEEQLGKVMLAVIEYVYNFPVREDQPDDFKQTIHENFNGDTACEIIFQMLITETL